MAGGRQEGGAPQFQLFRLSLPDQGAVAVWDQGITLFFEQNFANRYISPRFFLALLTRVSHLEKRELNSDPLQSRLEDMRVFHT